MRAMFSGAEESATVLKIESKTHALIQLDSGTRAVYSSDRFRLRKVTPAPAIKSAKTAAAATTAEEKVVDAATLRAKLAAKVGVPVAKVALNPHAAEGTPMHIRFVERAKALKDTHEVDVLIHGSPEQNVDSILRSSLSVQRSRHGSAFWLTEHLATAQGYMNGATRVVGFAALRRKEMNGAGIYVLNDSQHLLPLFAVSVV